MPLDLVAKKRLVRLAARDRAAREAAAKAREEFYAALVEARRTATVRELAEATGISFQRVHELTTVRNRRRGPVAAAVEREP